MFAWFRRWRRKSLLKEHRLPDALWNAAREQVGMVGLLSDADRQRLRDYATLFFHEKDFHGAGGLELSEEIKAVIAVQAVLPVIKLPYERLDGWLSVIVYPGRFRANHKMRDQNGLVNDDSPVLSGEAWSNSGLVLSWDDAQWHSDDPDDAHNVIIHEIAHKLDMANGAANGMPPLNRGMKLSKWTRAMSEAYEDLCERYEHRKRGALDPYATTNPAEFFAVLCEYFFESPRHLDKYYPEVYREMVALFKQDPAEWPGRKKAP